MVLDKAQILNYIVKPQNAHIKSYREDHNRLNIYFNGGDISSELEKISGYENTPQKTLRDNIARSPKDLVQRLLNQFSKVFSAKGGSESFDLTIKKQKENFIKLVTMLPEGISLSKWMQDYWIEGYVTDPNGLIFIESETGDDPKSYPAYKSINVIHDYTLTWSNLDYLILEHGKFIINEKETKVYRVIDDEIDALYYTEDNKTLKEFIELDSKNNEIPAVLNHKKGFVPAILMSDIIDKNTGGKKSFLNKIEDLLKEYVRESSVLSIFKFLHAYPRYWQYVSKCTTCNGVGNVTSQTDTTKKEVCPSCSGKKFNLNMDVSDGIMLPIPKNGDPVLAPNISGFSVPPIDAWDKMEDSLDKLEKKMEFAVLGTYSEQEKSNTATGRFIDSQPLETSLYKFSASEEAVKEKIAHFMALWMYGKNYGSIKILNGKRFISEHPDMIWDKYIKAKEAKAPISTLDYLYKQYLLSEYQNDHQMFEQKLKEFYVEPLVHYTITELDALKNTNLSIKVQQKIYFSDWLNDEATDFTKDVKVLKTEFETFITNKKLKDESITEN